MAKVPAFAKAFAGRWRIVEMDTSRHTRHQLSRFSRQRQPTSSTAC